MTNYTPSKSQFYVMFTTIYFHNFTINNYNIYKHIIDNTELLLLVVLIILIKAVDYTMCQYISSQYQIICNIVFRR